MFKRHSEEFICMKTFESKSITNVCVIWMRFISKITSKCSSIKNAGSQVEGIGIYRVNVAANAQSYVTSLYGQERDNQKKKYRHRISFLY